MLLALGLCMYAVVIVCICALVGANGDDDVCAPDTTMWLSLDLPKPERSEKVELLSDWARTK